MRTYLYVLLSLGILLLAGIYIFIPHDVGVSKVEDVESSERIIARYLNSDKDRRRWWPVDGLDGGKWQSDSSVLNYKGYQFKFRNADYNSTEVLIIHDGVTLASVITWNLINKNHIAIRWRTSIPTSYNPATRLIQYLQAHKLKSHMTAIMESMLTFIVNSKNVYGVSIERSNVKDTILASSKVLSIAPPETKEIYTRIRSIKKYIQDHDAKPVNPPMLNISRNEQGSFQTVIAVPIDKIIDTKGTIEINRMVAGNILVAKIKGGPSAIATGFDQIAVYLKDFKLTSPAMPFESLITDRLAEPDTSKWITKIYYPVF